MDPKIQENLDKYQKCENIISQTSLLSSYTGSVTEGYNESTEPIDDVGPVCARYHQQPGWGCES